MEFVQRPDIFWQCRVPNFGIYRFNNYYIIKQSCPYEAGKYFYFYFDISETPNKTIELQLSQLSFEENLVRFGGHTFVFVSEIGISRNIPVSKPATP